MYSIALGLALYYVLQIPIALIKASIFTVNLFSNSKYHAAKSWQEDLFTTIIFLEDHVLALPYVITDLIRRLRPQATDNLFMLSLDWVDHCYIQKHNYNASKDENHVLYYPTLALYDAKYDKSLPKVLEKLVFRLIAPALIYLLSTLPVVGRLILPLVSFYSLHVSLGLLPAVAIFIVGATLPRSYFVVALQAYFTSRRLLNSALEPWFTRIKFSREAKRAWFRERESVLMGFALPFYVLLRLPVIGPIAFGLASASAAFLITKVICLCAHCAVCDANL